ncbi:MAG: hypothetical protein P1V36_01905, partial [Planctomycetota bacterium]|nr:hypothetical protein [Planctomycetota bacterium]
VTIMSVKTTVAIVAACAVSAFLAGRHLAPAGEDALLTVDAPSARHDEGPALDARGAQLEKARHELKAAQERNAKLEQDNEALQKQLAALIPDMALPEGAAAGAGGSIYGPTKLRGVLEAQDWASAGDAARKLLPVLAELTSAIGTGTDVDESRMLDIAKHNGPLQTLAIGLAQDGVPGTGVNGSFTHPAASVNLVRATLAQAKVPLDDKQSARLNDLGDRYLEEDARRLAGYGDEVLALQKAIDEGDLKDRFYADVDALLTQAQVEVLHPPAVKGRLGVDIFSSGVIWHTLGKMIRFEDREDLAPRLARALMAEYKFTESEAGIVSDAAATWANSFSEEDLADFGERVYVESAGFSGGRVAGWAKLAPARRAAGYTLVLKQTLSDRLPAGSEGAARMRRSGPNFAMPLKK